MNSHLQTRQSQNLVQQYLDVHEVRFCYFETGREYQSDGTILLVHATGFHARCWDRTVDLLGDSHIISLDMRGHGRSDNVPPFTWDQFGADVGAFIEALSLSKITGVGHSMGGHSIVSAAAKDEGCFARLVLVDPVILAPEAYQSRTVNHEPWLTESGQHPVARRRNQFDSPEAFYDNLSGRGSYAQWRPEVLKDYCDYGLVPDPEGPGFVLACPPSVEAAIYMGSSGDNIYQAVAAIGLPVTVLRAREREDDRGVMDFSSSPTWPALASHFQNGLDVHLPHLTHFIPMQDPPLTADYITARRTPDAVR